MSTELTLTPSDVNVSHSYLLTSTAFQPLFGRLYASFNVKLVFLVSFLIFEIGSLICGVAQDSPTFIVGRAIAGLGLAGGYSGCLIIISLSAPLHIRPLLTSLVGATYGIGGTIGPIIGGALTSEATWRWCFYLNLFFIPIVAVTVLFFLHVPNKEQPLSVTRRLLSIDWQGTALALCSIICILLVFQWGGVDHAWSSSTIIGLIVGFVLIGAVFWVDQWYMGERATIPLRIFKNRTILGGSIANFMIASSYFTLLYFLPIYFQAIRGSSAIRSGVQTLPFIVSVITAVTVTGGLVNKFGHYIPYLFLGTGLMAIGGGALYTMDADASQSMWVGLQFLAGIGPGMAFMLPFIASSAVLEPRDIELGSAVVIFFQTLGGTISTSLAQAVFQNKFSLYLSSIPGADPAQVLSHGVTAFRELTPAEVLPAVVNAGNKALTKTWLMCAIFGCISFVSVFIMELNRKVDVQGSKEAESAKAEKQKGDVEQVQRGQ